VRRATSAKPAAGASASAAAYSRASAALSYNIFSKCGTSHSSSVLYRAIPPPNWS
jgi:hypothetical protein